MEKRVFLRGDTHGNFDWLADWCEQEHTTTNDILIILGDSALRFEGPNSAREKARKSAISQCPITILAVRGNHDRPFTEKLRADVELMECPYLEGTCNNQAWHDKNYPNIWYFNEECPNYQIRGHSFCILPGAYSVDKYYRLMMHWTWYEDEQLTHEEQISYLDWVDNMHFNFVLSHSCPMEWMPTDLFLKGLDQSTVDNSTERWLSDVLKYIGYDNWYFGHFHANREYGKVGLYDWQGSTTMLFEKIIQII